MKRILLFSAAIAAIVACSKESKEAAPEVTSFESGQLMTLNIGTESATKATSSLNADGVTVDFKWQEGDKIKLSVGGKSSEFTLKSGAGQAKASFEGTMPASGNKFDLQYPVNTPDIISQAYSSAEAIPHDKMLFSASDCSIGSDFTLNAQNSVLRLNLYAQTANTKVGSIIVKKSEDAYTLTMSAAVTLPTESASAKAFFIVVPTGNYKFNAIIKDGSGDKICDINANSYNDFISGKIVNMPAKEVIPSTEPKCLCIEAIGTKESEVILKKGSSAPTVSLKYSKNGGQSWYDLTVNTAYKIQPGEKMYIQAPSEVTQTQFASGSTTPKANYFKIAPTGPTGREVKISGNIMYLLSSDNPSTVNMGDYCFCRLFQESTCIKDISELSLPATSLTKYCYYYMFYHDTALTSTTPILPATTLKTYCYGAMYGRCVGITVAPNLPATTLAPWCYWAMFAGGTDEGQNGTNITTAPALPATTLKASCYHTMFGRCKSLVNPPVLPAESMESSCYESMFSECTSLENAPELPATILAENCYNAMFYACTSLTNAPVLTAKKLELSCYQGMFNGCSKLGTVTMLATEWSSGGWSADLSEWLLNAGTEVSTPTVTVAKGMKNDVEAAHQSKGITNWTVVEQQ